jgi:hypothetical protein
MRKKIKFLMEIQFMTVSKTLRWAFKGFLVGMFIGIVGYIAFLFI